MSFVVIYFVLMKTERSVSLSSCQHQFWSSGSGLLNICGWKITNYFITIKTWYNKAGQLFGRRPALLESSGKRGGSFFYFVSTINVVINSLMAPHTRSSATRVLFCLIRSRLRSGNTSQRDWHFHHSHFLPNNLFVIFTHTWGLIWGSVSFWRTLDCVLLFYH